MTYFLKKKKWMAWVVLLTFLFTSFMPTNLLAGNSVAEAADSLTPPAVSNDDGVTVSKTAVRTGLDTWEVTLGISGGSTETQKKTIDVVLVLDRSGSMTFCDKKMKYDGWILGSKHYQCPVHAHQTSWDENTTCTEQITPADAPRNQAAQNAANELANTLYNNLDNVNVNISVIGFGDDAITTLELTPMKKDNYSKVTDAISRAQAKNNQGTYTAKGLEAAYTQIGNSKSDEKYVILLTDGKTNSNKDTVKSNADKIKQKATLYTVGLMLDNNTSAFLRDKVASKNCALTADNVDTLIQKFRDIVADILNVINNGFVTDTMGDAVDYVSASEGYPADGHIVETTDDKLAWNTGESVSAEGATLKYTVKLNAKELAKQTADNWSFALNQQAILAYADKTGAPKSITYPVPMAEVDLGYLNVTASGLPRESTPATVTDGPKIVSPNTVWESQKFSASKTESPVVMIPEGYELKDVKVKGESKGKGFVVGELVATKGTTNIEYVYGPKQVDYTIEYYYDGKIDSSLTRNSTAAYGTNVYEKIDGAVEVGSTHYNDQKKTGYKYSTMDVPAKLGERNNVIKVYYVKDEEQTQPTNYVVKHVVNGVEQTKDTKTYTGTAWINETDPKIEVEAGSVDPKTYTGYKYASTSPNVKAGESVNSGTVITLTYVKDESQTQPTNYVVKHVVNGVEQTKDTKTYTGTAWINETDPKIEVEAGSVDPKTYTGYKYASTSPNVKAGESVNSGTVITLTYVKDESQTQPTNYVVKHVVNGVEQTKDTKTYTGTAWINETDPKIEVEAGSVDPKTYTGYKYASTSPNVKAGESVNSGTVITLTYVKDESQTQPTNYVVKHVVNGVEQTKDTKTYTGTAWINETDPKIEVEAGSVDPKTYTGYKYASTSPNVKAGESVNSGTVITLTYVKDESQTQPTNYVVKHVVNGVEQTKDTKTYTGTAWINETDPKIEVEAGSVDPKTYTGYKYASTSPNVKAGESVNSGTVITLTYVKDESQTQPTNYVVKHVVNGVEQTKDTKTYTGTAWINETDPKIEVEAGSVDPKTYTGYKYASTSPNVKAGESVNSGTVITLTYVKDESQTQPTNYVVKHVVNGVEQTKDTKTYTGTAWINETDPKIEVEAGSVDPKTYTGYKYASTSPNVKAGESVNSGTVITLTYVKDESQTQPTNYVVKHVVNGVEQTKDTKTYTGTAWINETDPKIEVEAGSVDPKTYTGYKYASTSPNVKAGESVNSGTVITLTYVKDESQTQPTNYVVKHVVNGVEQTKDTKTYTGTAWINETDPKIEVEAGSVDPKTYTGYKYASTSPNVKAGESVNSGTVITLTYVKDDNQTQVTKYTVHYTIEGVEQTNDKIEVTDTAWINDNPAQIAIAEGGIPAPADKYTGYKLDSSNLEYPAAGTKVNSGSEYTVNYIPIDYTVTYDYEGTVPAGAAEQLPAATDKNHVNTLIKVADEPSVSGYVFSGWKVKEPEDIKISDGTFTMPAHDVTLVGSWTLAGDTAYTVNYYYQSQDGNYGEPLFTDTLVTTTGALVFADTTPNGDYVTTPSLYQFNPNAEGTVTQATVAADGTTVLNVFFDQVYRVVYKYTDGSVFNYVIDDTGYIFNRTSNFAPPMLNWDVNTGADFDNVWYDNAVPENGQEWNVWDIAGAIASGSAAFDKATNTLTLYTTAKVSAVPTITGQLNVAKLVNDKGNKTNGNEEFKFELKITEIKQSQVLDPLTKDEAEKLHHYNSENRNAQAADEKAQEDLKHAVEAFKGHTYTTASALSFVIADDNDISLYSVTTGSEMGWTSYDGWTAFDCQGDKIAAGSTQETVLNKIIEFIKDFAAAGKAMPQSEEATKMFMKDMMDYAGVATGSAITFRSTDLYELYDAAGVASMTKDAAEKKASALEDFLKEINRWIDPDIKVVFGNEMHSLSDYKNADGTYTISFNVKGQRNIRL